ncbi:cell filamentation protein Fic [Pseudomonas putida]|uniref:protein adenylyltransferase n=1 Tax=Pseudomonas putida TaxID=303 RepID=A0A1Y3LS85_PSEPU|nr:putative adenosine monophosphate-protein transferase Fic [Pseudomonas putida]OUM39060.1 cell filamentation protein Fic [Pseudomonas putida]
MRDKYGIAQDPYCYPSSQTLRNKLGIQEDDQLEKAERLLTAISAEQIEFEPPPYDLAYLRRIHAALFSDLYDWAGQLRTVAISKQDTRFCQPEFMERQAAQVFQRIEAADWYEQMSRDELIVSVTNEYSELNVAHPFRDGNGRAQRILFEHIVYNAGYDISWWAVEPDQWLDANIATYHCNLRPLTAIFGRCIGARLT